MTSSLVRDLLVTALFRSLHHFCSRFVQNDTLLGIELAIPRRLLERAHGLCVAGLPAHADAGRAEIDVFGVVFVRKLRRQQAHNMHGCMAAVGRERLRLRSPANLFRQQRGEPANNMPHVMQLTLPRDVACDSAGILNVLMAVEDLPNRAWLFTHRIPEMNRKDKRVLARIVVEDHFGWRIRKDAAVPIKLAVDAYRRKSRWQCAGRHDVLDVNLAVAAIEVAHPACTYVCGANGESWTALVDQGKIDELEQRPFQRCSRIETGCILAQGDVCAQECSWVGFEKIGDATEDRLPV